MPSLVVELQPSHHLESFYPLCNRTTSMPNLPTPSDSEIEKAFNSKLNETPAEQTEYLQSVGFNPNAPGAAAQLTAIKQAVDDVNNVAVLPAGGTIGTDFRNQIQFIAQSSINPSGTGLFDQFADPTATAAKVIGVLGAEGDILGSLFQSTAAPPSFAAAVKLDADYEVGVGTGLTPPESMTAALNTFLKQTS